MSAGPGAVGIVGLGQIGGGIARALARSGWTVTAYDLSSQASARLAPVTTLAPSPAAVAEQAAVILVAVLDDVQVRDVLDGPDGILSATARGQTVVILSTIDVETVKWAGETARRRGLAVVDCGVSGGPRAAAAGALVTMLGGEADAIEAARAIVEAFSSKVVHVGPLGAGIRLKLARNLVTYCSWMAADEAARLAASGGVPAERLVDVIRASDPMTGGVTGLLGGDPSNRPAAGALAAIAEKDLLAALTLAEREGIDLPLTRLANAGIEDVIERARNGSDDGEIT